MDLISTTDLIDLASERTAEWLDAWYLFIVVVTALLGAVVALRKSLSWAYGKLLIVGFTLFVLMQIGTLHRHYRVFDYIRELLVTREELCRESVVEGGACSQELIAYLQDPVELLDRIGPPNEALIYAACGVFWLLSAIAVTQLVEEKSGGGGRDGSGNDGGGGKDGGGKRWNGTEPLEPSVK